MKPLQHLFKYSIAAATVLGTLIISSCTKETPTNSEPDEKTNAIQPVPDQVPSDQEVKNEPQPSSETQEQGSDADQDMQMLKEIEENDAFPDSVAAAYGPQNAAESSNAPKQINSDNRLTQERTSKKRASKSDSLPAKALKDKLRQGHIDLDNPDQLDWAHFDPDAMETSMVAYYGPTPPGSTWKDQSLSNRNRLNVNVRKIPSKVIVHNLDVIGPMDDRLVLKYINNHKSELRACYERELTKTKAFTGKVQVKWIIDKNGTVLSVAIDSSTLNNKNMENCLVNSIKRWRFPQPKKNNLVQVTCPISFSTDSK